MSVAKVEEVLAKIQKDFLNLANELQELKLLLGEEGFDRKTLFGESERRRTKAIRQQKKRQPAAAGTLKDALPAIMRNGEVLTVHFDVELDPLTDEPGLTGESVHGGKS